MTSPTAAPTSGISAATLFHFTNSADNLISILTHEFEPRFCLEDIDTAGGLVFSRHGTVPEVGTEVLDSGNGLVFMVEEMDERRIVSVTARRMEEPDPSALD